MNNYFVIDKIDDSTLARKCALCGKSFSINAWSTETICPSCKELWAKIKEKNDDQNIQSADE